MHIGILYKDLSIAWLPFDLVDKLLRNLVLAITLTTERGNRKALVERMWSLQNNDKYAGPDPWWGDDNYVIGVTPDGDFFTDQWPDKDGLRLRSIEDPHNTLRVIARDRGYPPDATLHLFRGAYLPPGQWKVALAKIEKELY